MKYLLILSSVFMAVNTFAAATCDLDVSVPRFKDAKTTTIILEDKLKDTNDRGESYIRNLLHSKLLKKCEDQGAENCTVTYNSSTLDEKIFSLDMVTTYYATVSGTKTTGGKKLSDSEYAKRKQQAICQKVDSCINAALNDNDSPANFMEKLYMIKEKTNCNQTENFLFDN